MKCKRILLFIVLLIVPFVVKARTMELVKEDNYDKSDAGSFALYYKDKNGKYNYYDTLYFDKNVSKKELIVKEFVYGIRLVKKSGYELNIDELTLNGNTDNKYFKKLIDTDNDVIEVENGLNFNLNGIGKLVISGRAPLTLKGTEYALRFPDVNYMEDIDENSKFLNYKIGSHRATISDKDLVLPDKSQLFYHKDKVVSGSGHPTAPIDYYVANDDNYLYIFTEAFGDNTFDHGKDYSKVYIKTGDGIKEYQVNTVEENEYGKWWFEYTNNEENIKWQHMSYLIKVPMEDIKDDNIELLFEYYGTLCGPFLYIFNNFYVKTEEGTRLEDVTFKIELVSDEGLDECYSRCNSCSPNISDLSCYPLWDLYSPEEERTYIKRSTSNSEGLITFEGTQGEEYYFDTPEEDLALLKNRTIKVTQLTKVDGYELPEPKFGHLEFRSYYDRDTKETFVGTLWPFNCYSFPPWEYFDVYFDLVFDDGTNVVVNKRENKAIEKEQKMVLSTSMSLSQIFTDVDFSKVDSFDIKNKDVVKIENGVLIPLKVGTTDIGFQLDSKPYLIHLVIVYDTKDNDIINPKTSTNFIIGAIVLLVISVITFIIFMKKRKSIRV